MDNVKRYSSFIKYIVTAPDPLRKKLLKSSNLSIIKAICEIIHNIRQKNITVPKSTLKQLKLHRKVLYKVVEGKGFGVRKTILINNSKAIAPLAAIFK